jgi:predicted PurR-regulated permease PerM
MSSSRRPVSGVGWAVAALLAYLVFLIVRPFVTSLAWAAVIAIVCQPLHARLRSRMSGSRSALVTTLIATVAVVGPLSLLAAAFVSEGLDAVNHLQQAAAGGALASAQGAVSRMLDMVPVLRAFDLRAALLDGAQRAAVVLGGYSTSVLRHTATFLFDVTLALFGAFFLLRDGSRIIDVLRNVIPLEDPQRERLFSDTASLITAGVRSSLFVAALQGFLGGCVFAAVGIAAPVLWGVVMGVCCLLPLGAWVI